MYIEVPFKTGILIIITGFSLILARGTLDQAVGLCNISFLPNYREFVDARPVENSSLSVETQWSREAGIWDAYNGATSIVVTDQLVIVTDDACHEIVAFDRLTGETKWRDTGGGNMAGVAYDDRLKRIYLTRPNHPQIVAYRITDGKQLWANKSIRGRPIDLIVQEPVGVDSIILNAGRLGYIPVNQRDGRFGEPFDIDSDAIAFNREIFVSNDRSGTISVTDAETKEVLWEFSFATLGCCDNRNKHVIFTRQQIIMKIYDSLYVFDKDSGDVEWQIESPPIASNAVVDGELVYILDFSANLRLLSLDDGTEVGHIQFEAPQNERDLIGSVVAAHDDVVAVYFQDTETLSILEIDMDDIRH